LELAPEGMPITLARQWAEKGSVESTSKRLQDTEVWVAELDDQDCRVDSGSGKWLSGCAIRCSWTH